MTTTYQDDAPTNVKLLEEIRCLRCVNERILRALDESQFPAYQMEKFSGNADSRSLLRSDKCVNIMKDTKDILSESEDILKKLNESLFVDYLMEKSRKDMVHENDG